MSLDGSGSLSGLSVLLGLLALGIEADVFVFNLSRKSASHSGSEELDYFLLAKLVNLVGSIASEAVLC